MKLPNSYGSVTKLSGKRRRPYTVRITVGWTDEGGQIRKVVGYYRTKAEAITALAEYHQHPYDLDTRGITFAELYQKWAADTYKESGVPNCYTAAYNRLSNLHDMPFADIRTRHMQGEIDACELGYSTKKNLKTLCNKLSNYAMEREIIMTNYATLCTLPTKQDSRIHQPFTPSELETLWANTDDDGARLALILCYTGLRPTELAKIKTENVHLDERYMMGGMKTAAGKNRAVPIAKKIYPFIEAMYNPDAEYLFMDKKDGKPVATYDRLREHYWEHSPVLRTMNHLPHDGRHTCASMLDDADTPLKITQLILGHRSANVTHRVYTHKTIAQLIKAIDRI